MKTKFVPADNGCCGVYAIAETTCLPFSSVWNVANFALQKKASWRGSTTYEERLHLLDSLEATHYAQSAMVGLTLLEAIYLAVEQGGHYVFDLSAHSIAFKDGRLIDQSGTYHPVKYSRRFHRLNHVTRVYPVKDFDEDRLFELLLDPLA